MEVEWLPFELHPEVPPEGMEIPWHLRAHFNSTQDHLRKMAREAGMEMVFPDHIPNSRRALEASEYAREQGKHEPFHTTVFRKFYGKGHDLRSWETLRAAAEEVGLDPDAMQEATDNGKYKEAVTRLMSGATSRGITAVPAYVFENKYLIMGAQPYEVFCQTMEQLGVPSRLSENGTDA